MYTVPYFQAKSVHLIRGYSQRLQTSRVETCLQFTSDTMDLRSDGQKTAVVVDIPNLYGQ